MSKSMRAGWASLVLVASIPAAALEPMLSGSASLDYRSVSGPTAPQNPSVLGINGLTLEVAQKVVVDVGHGVSFTAKACGGCHGLELDQAYGEVHFKPLFNFRVGRINVPFGEFTVRHDPSNFSTPSKPLPYAMGDMLNYSREGFNLGIVPAPYVDNGLEVFGSLSLGDTVQLDYTVYGIKGLAGDNDLDFASSRTYVDNNKLPAFGARLVLTGEDWAIGASGNAGTYDPKDQLWYLMAGLDFYLRLGPVVLRAEALGRRTDLDPTAQGYPYTLVDRWFLKAGWYAQVDWTPHPQLSVVLRSDGLQRFGMPLPESELTRPTVGVQRQTLALLVRANEHLAVKLDYELWTFSGTPYLTRHMGRLGVVFGY
jgi:hypothetical protein